MKTTNDNHIEWIFYEAWKILDLCFELFSSTIAFRCQFHQHKRTNFSYERRFFTYMYLEKSCQNDISYKKFVRKLLMKLTVDGNIRLLSDQFSEQKFRIFIFNLISKDLKFLAALLKLFFFFLKNNTSNKSNLYFLNEKFCLLKITVSREYCLKTLFNQ